MTSDIRSYRDLKAWQAARVLVKSVYEATASFPPQEVYGLTGQLRRASVSVPSNIAEGYGRGSRKDYIHFLQNARGSMYEVETQIILAQDLNFLEPQPGEVLLRQAEECSRILNGLIRGLENSNG